MDASAIVNTKDIVANVRGLVKKKLTRRYLTRDDCHIRMSELVPSSKSDVVS
jgi:hypothetical protein